MRVPDVVTQVGILSYKDAILAKRSYILSLCRLILPLLGVFLILIIATGDFSIYSDPHPDVGPEVGDLPKCKTTRDDGECVTLFWNYNGFETPEIENQLTTIMQLLCSTNPTPLTYGVDVQKTNLTAAVFGSSINSILPNYTYGLINWESIENQNNAWNFSYKLWYNGTLYKRYNMFENYIEQYYNNYRYSFETAVDRAILAYLSNDPEATIQVFSKNYPIPDTTTADISTYVWSLCLNVFFITMTFPFAVELVQIVSEKERGLRGQLVIGGLKSISYWIEATIRQTLFGFAAIFIMVSIGWLFPQMIMFHDANYFVLLIIFASYSFNVNALASLVSPFLGKRKSANIWACIIFGVGLLLVFGIASFLDDLLYEAFSSQGTRWTRWLQSIPFFAFAKALVDVKILTVGPNYDTSCTDDEVISGYSFSQFFQSPSNTCDVPSTFNSCCWMVLEGFVFLIATWWLDQVLPDKFKATENPFFCMRPSYYRTPSLPDIERSECALEVEHLTKTYKKGRFSSEGVTALRPFELTCPNSTILCLLGPNGAGKSTTISCLTGLTPPTEGDAKIFGMSILTCMPAIRRIMGVCPQFDVLWDQLSAWQHCKIFNGLKPKDQRMTNEQLEDMLVKVKLFDVRNDPIKTYSGGMKRRISVVLSMVGDPKVIFLDEPTTGMDPDNRRYVWDLIREFKKGRLIILTTHSMEEADILGERIGIIAQGKLRAEGSPLELKARFGMGYRVTLTTNPEKVEDLKNFVRKTLPGAQLRGDNAGALVYSLPDVDPDESVARFFEYLQSQHQGERLVEDWGIHNTTMEDVFLTVARKIMGQDITFVGDNKKNQFDRDDREMFRETSKRFEVRLRYLQSEVSMLRELLAKNGIDASIIPAAADQEEDAHLLG